RVVPLLDAGRPARDALHLAAARHRADDAHGQTVLERRANPPRERYPGRPFAFAERGPAPRRDPLSYASLPTLLAMGRTAPATTDATLVRPMRSNTATLRFNQAKGLVTSLRINASRVLHVVSSALLLTSCATVNPGVLHAADEQPFGIERRIPWTTSRVIGSPDPPLPYTVGKTFTNIKWQAPVY